MYRVPVSQSSKKDKKKRAKDGVTEEEESKGGDKKEKKEKTEKKEQDSSKGDKESSSKGDKKKSKKKSADDEQVRPAGDRGVGQGCQLLGCDHVNVPVSVFAGHGHAEVQMPGVRMCACVCLSMCARLIGCVCYVGFCRPLRKRPSRRPAMRPAAQVRCVPGLLGVLLCFVAASRMGGGLARMVVSHGWWPPTLPQ